MAAKAPARPRPRPWEYSLGMGVGYDDNIEFRLARGPSSMAFSPRGTLRRALWSPRGQLRLTGNASCVGYSKQRDLSRPNLAVDMDGYYDFSPTTMAWTYASYEFGYSDSSQILTEQGVLLPLVSTRTATAVGGLTWRLGLRTSLIFEGRFYAIDFDKETSGLAGLVDGRSARARAGLEWKIGPRATTSLEYSLENSLGRKLTDAASPGVGTVDNLTHFGSLQWGYALSSRAALKLETGASYTPEATQAGLDRQSNFYGGATFVRKVKRSDVMLFVRREVTPAFGLGVSRVETRFGLHAWVVIGQDWTFEFAGTRVKSSIPENAYITYGTPDQIVGSLRRRLGSQLELSAEAQYRRRSPVASLAAVEGFRVGLFFSVVSPRDFTLPPSERDRQRQR